jgi:DNA (cytosine-5)-methyltransferase 1
MKARDYKDATDLVIPFVKSRRAQSAEDDETWVNGKIANTLNQFDTGDTRTTTAIVGSLEARDYKGLNHEGARDGKAIIEPIGIQGNMIGRADHNGPAGRGYTADGDPMFTLTSTDVHAVSVLQYDGYNQRAHENDVSVTVRIGRDSSDCIMPNAMIVRRLTPVECERLMGWPDDHTRWRADGKEQADTQRYRQCGNGVASPVAQWIAGHLLSVLG